MLELGDDDREVGGVDGYVCFIRYVLFILFVVNIGIVILVEC